jgi:hypothetical protein
VTNAVMSIVAALILTENSGPTAVGRSGDVGVLQITPIMHREYVRLGGKLPLSARTSPMLSKQIATLVLTRRMEKRGLRGDFGASVVYAAWLWNPGDAGYEARLRGNML